MIRLILVLTLYLLAGLATAQEHDHNLYDPICCTPSSRSGDTGDCAPIPNSAVRLVPGRAIVTLRPGDHPMVTREHTYEMPWDRTIGGKPTIKPAKDGQFHACLWPNEDTLRCLYVAPGGA
jgi:hypothetical protein